MNYTPNVLHEVRTNEHAIPMCWGIRKRAKLTRASTPCVHRKQRSSNDEYDLIEGERNKQVWSVSFNISKPKCCCQGMK